VSLSGPGAPFPARPIGSPACVALISPWSEFE